MPDIKKRNKNHEKSKSKSFEKKEQTNTKKSSPLKFMGSFLSSVTNKAKNNMPSGGFFGSSNIGNTVKNNVKPDFVNNTTRKAINSLQDTFYPKNAVAPGNKSPFKKISKEALTKNPARPLDKKIATMTRKRNQTK
jgi:hypothetical protein